jgi:uncharacterized membrane protein
MATPTLSSLPQIKRLRAKDLVFAFIGLMILYVLYHNERFLIDAKDPIWNHYEPFKWWLLPHAVAGACALLLAPMQFSDRLRQRFTKMHRVVGRVYVAGVFIAAPLGAYVQFFEERLGGTRSFSIATVVDASLWMITTGIAFGFVLRGKILQHRQWMTRSFAVALVFLEVRLIAGITGWEKLGEGAFETIVWVCLAFSLLIGDIAIQWQELSRTRRA